MARTSDIKFNTTSFLPVLNAENWVLTNATISAEGVLTISPEGSAVCEPSQTIINLCFQYCEIVVDYQSVGITPSNNFRSKPKILIRETYKNNDNAIDQIMSRVLGFNVFKEVSAEDKRYIDTTIFKTPNKNLAHYRIEIRNTLETEDLVIYNVGAFSSIDISADQVGGVINDVNNNNRPASFKVYFNDGSYSLLSGLSASMANSSKELKFKPIYSNGLLGSIETNFGVTYDVVNIPEPIDLST